MSEHKHVRTLQDNRRKRVLPILSAIYDAEKPVPSTEISASYYDLTSLASEGLIRKVEEVDSGKRGRPAFVYRITDKGRKRVKRARS